MFNRQVIDEMRLYGDDGIAIELAKESDPLAYVRYIVEVDDGHGRWGKSFILRSDAVMFEVAVADAHIARARGEETESLYMAAVLRYECAKRAIADARRRSRSVETRSAAR